MESRFWRLGVAYFALTGLVQGAYAAVAPRYYFEHFPGAGHAWVALDGPYNEHLMRDYGALNLALGVVAVCALLYWSRPLIVTVSLAEIVYALPHVAYHLAHPSRLGATGDQIGAIGGLLVAPVIAVLLLLLARPDRAPRRGHREAEPTPRLP